MRNPIRLALAGLLLLALPAFGRWDRGAVSLRLPSGSLEVEVVPEGGRPLAFEPAGDDRFWYQGPTSDLVGKPYSILLRNRTDERLKVVVAVDGVNVYRKDPLRGTSDADTGSILRRDERRELGGFQVDRHTAQRFVFSPPEWSEGEGRTERQIGVIEVHVYREWHPRVWAQSQGATRDEEARAEEKERPSAQRSAPAEPPIGTTAGEDYENEVRRVRFVSASRFPEARAVLVYGRPEEAANGVRLGIRGEETRGGIRIVEVFPRSTAEDVGLLPGDLIVKVDSVASPRIRELQRILDHKRSGDYLFLEVERRVHRLSIKVRLD